MDASAIGNETPRGISIIDRGESMEVHIRWFRWGYVPTAVFLALFFVLAFDFLTTVPKGGQGPRSAGFGVLLLQLWIAGILLIVGYGVLRALLNRTVLSFGPEEITVRHTPLPWHEPLPIKVSEVLRASSEFVYSGVLFWSRRRLRLVFYSGEELVLIGGRATLGEWLMAEQAEFLAQTVNGFLARQRQSREKGQVKY